MVPTVRIERVAELPGGRAAVLLQREGEIVLRMQGAEVTDRGALAVQRLLQGEIDSGRLRQDWPGDTSPGHPASRG